MESHHEIVPDAADSRLGSRARDLMTPGVIAISEEASVAQAERSLLSHGRHGVLVVARDTGRPLGWVTARGLLSWLQRDKQLARARDAITEPAVSVHPFDSPTDVIELMDRENVGQVLVSHDPGEAPEGVIAVLDIVRRFAS
jgi:CBS domain-containing protein